MHILVTGGAGYIGSHTALALKRAGFVPVVLDDLSQGHETAVKYGPFVRGDMGDAAQVRALCAQYQPKALIHFAALTNVAESVAKPDLYQNNNFHKAARLFDTVAVCGVNTIVFSSSAAVYGIPETPSAIREDAPLRPINPYGQSKLAAEKHLLGFLARGIAMRSIALRYFNAAGAMPEEGLGEAHEPETHLIPNAILAGLGRKDKLHVFGTDYLTHDGTATRDFVHVMDLADAHVAALRYLLAGGETDVFNLGCGRGVTVREVIKAVERALGCPVPTVLEERRPGDPPYLVADVLRARERLGWEPNAALEKIVESAVAWHRGAGTPPG